jgi:hypothetical protein
MNRLQTVVRLGLVLSLFLASVVPAAAAQVAASDTTKAIITADGSLWMWGYRSFESGAMPGAPCNTSGQCDISRPTKVGDGYQSIAVGNSHALAIKIDGSLWAWGANDQGQLGDGTTQARSMPVAVGSGFVSVFAGGQGALGHSLGIKSDGSLWAWGNNKLGQVGDGTLTSRTQPVQIASSGYIAVAATGDSSAALKSDGSLWVWGGHNLINGSAVGAPLQPVQLASGFTALSANNAYFTALKSDGGVWVWGFTPAIAGQTCVNDYPDSSYCAQPQQLASGFSRIAASAGLKTVPCCPTCSCVGGDQLWWWHAGPTYPCAPGVQCEPNFQLQQIGSGFSALADGIASKTDGSVWTWPGVIRTPLQALPAIDSQGQPVSGSTFNLNGNTAAYPVRASFGIVSSTQAVMVEPVWLSAQVQVAAADVGKAGQLFALARAGGNWLQLSKNQGWQPASSLQPYDSVTLGSHSVYFYFGMLADLKDVNLYIGYGTSAEAMQANGTWQEVFRQ